MGGLEKSPFESLGWLLTPLIQGGALAIAKDVIRHLTNHMTETAKTAHFKTTYTDGSYYLLYSEHRTDAVILDALLNLDDDASKSICLKLVAGLNEQRRNGRWTNTQENTWVLVALNHYFEKYESITPNYTAKVWLRNMFAGEHKFVGRSTKEVLIPIPMSEVAKEKKVQQLSIAKEGQGKLYYRLGLRYAPEDLQLLPLDRGFEVKRVYSGAKLIPKTGDEPERLEVKLGAKVTITLTMKCDGRRYHVALVDNLPGGFEPINPNLAKKPDQKMRSSWWFRHSNYRDSRVEAFVDQLYEGTYTFTYDAMATCPGIYTAPPAKAEEMYMPETFGRSGTLAVHIS
jgi:uncharacterized protein YfaS (alpha-2-macroglobulin family)